jgi:hypothetical protein
MKSTLLASLALAGAVSFSAAYERFDKYEECVAYCDKDSTCQAAYYDTISGDCQTAECLTSQTPPGRFKPYLKSTATQHYCPGSSPTGTPTPTTTKSTEPATSASGTGTAPAATQSTGASAGWAALRVNVVSAAAAVCVAMGFLA